MLIQPIAGDIVSQLEIYFYLTGNRPDWTEIIKSFRLADGVLSVFWNGNIFSSGRLFIYVTQGVNHKHKHTQHTSLFTLHGAWFFHIIIIVTF